MAKRRTRTEEIDVDLSLEDGVARSSTEICHEHAWPEKDFTLTVGAHTTGIGEHPYIDDEEREPGKHDIGLF